MLGVSDLVVRNVLEAAALAELRSWSDDVQRWPAGSHIWGQYAERTPRGDVICRTENVSACHDQFCRLVDGALAQIVTERLGTAVVAFKDKMNYKQPGGAGFRPHQDQVAYPGAANVMSILVAIDECSVESGCIWLAGGVDALLPTDDRGVVRADVAEALKWEPVELAPGDAVCLPGYAPHYSAANQTECQRRVFITSYSPASNAYTREDYYAARQAVMTDATARDGRFRISTLADFEGMETPATHPLSCTHA